MNKLGLAAIALVFALSISGAISKPVYAHSLLTVGQIGDAVEVVGATSPGQILLAKGKGKGKGQGKGQGKGKSKDVITILRMVKARVLCQHSEVKYCQSTSALSLQF